MAKSSKSTKQSRLRSADGQSATLVSASLPGVDEINLFFKFISDKHNWLRLGWIVAGGVLIFLAVLALIKRSGIIEQADKVGATVAKAAVVK